MVTMKELLNAAKATRNIWVLFSLAVFHKRRRVYFRNGINAELNYSEYWCMVKLLEYLRDKSFDLRKTTNGYLLQAKNGELKFKTPFLGASAALIDLLTTFVSEGWGFIQSSDSFYHFCKNELECTLSILGDDLFNVEFGKVELLGPYDSIYMYFFESPHIFSSVDFEGKVVLDIGGFCGETAVFFWSQGATKVIIYEPVPDHQKLIRTNMIRNNVKAEIHDEGIGEIDGTQTVAYDSLNIGFGLHVGKKKLKVKIRKAEYILEISGADVAKIDCEGAETSLLTVPTSILRRVDSYIIETHTPSVRKAIIDKFIKSGFNQSNPLKNLTEEISVLYFEKKLV